jgi:hypothetical protein
MSIRAHRVIEIKTSGSSFNLYHDEDVTDWLEMHTYFFHSLNEDSCGLTGVSVEELKDMLSEIGEKLHEDVKKSIKEDIEFAESQGNGYVQYYCY